MLVLLFVALCFILRGDLFYVLSCVILFLCFFVLLALRLSRLGRRELIAFRTFVGFALVWFCLFPLPLCFWEGQWFVIVALPGLFSYLFLCNVCYGLVALSLVVIGRLFCDCCSSWTSSLLQSTPFIPTLGATTNFIPMII